MLQILASNMYLHIPDGFLSITVSIVCWLIAAAALYLALQKSQNTLDERLVPLAGIMAAFIFAGQMINFPIAGGTSGHLIGATLATIVLGPWLGILVMSAVIILQALLFQDGGLVVMGANLIVMGIVPAFVGFGLFRLAAHRSRVQKLALAGIAAWLSVVAGAFVTALLLGFSGTVSLAVVVPIMVGVHALIGLGEALITVAALSFISQTRPQLLEQGTQAGGRGWVVGGVILSLLVVLLAPLASASPDGLEFVAKETGFMSQAQESSFSILPDYVIPALGQTNLSTIVAGLIGVILLIGIMFVVTKMLRRQPNYAHLEKE